MALTFDIDGLQEVMGPGAYRTMTDGGLDAVATIALTQAEILVNSKYDLAEMTPDWTDQTVIMAGLCYAVYYLYANKENEIIAKDKMACGNNLLASIIGQYAFYDGGGSEAALKSMQSIFIVEEGTDCWNGFGGF